MYDGTNFMGIKSYDQCQFFESDVILGSSGDGDTLFRTKDKGAEYMKRCPEEDTCCFSLREYMSIDFWGRKYSDTSTSFIYHLDIYSSGCTSSV
jgi:hypothetical protein